MSDLPAPAMPSIVELIIEAYEAGLARGEQRSHDSKRRAAEVKAGFARTAAQYVADLDLPAPPRHLTSVAPITSAS